METAIRWSPHAVTDKSQFVLLDILDSSLTLNEVIDTDKENNVQHGQISSLSKLPSFAAFDWSQTSAHVISLGHISGSASLIKLLPGVQTSQIVATYRVKQQRRCNSIAFNSSNWLAVALDKTRSDLCLNLYDAASTSLDPIRRLCPAELVSSVRFFDHQPQEILLGAQRSFLRLYDLRDGFSAGSGNLQVATKNVNNITIDPLNENYFASGGVADDPSITIWDKRKLHSSGGADTASIFDFKIASTARTSVWAMRFSGKQQGRLAVCSSAGGLRVIDMRQSHVQVPVGHEQSIANPLGGQPWHSAHYVSNTFDLEHPRSDQQGKRHDGQQLMAFDWIRDRDSNSKQQLFGLYADRRIRMLTLHPRMALSVSSKHEVGIASDAIDTLAASNHSIVKGNGYQIDTAEDFGPSQYSGEISIDSAAEGPATDTHSLSLLLASGLLQRERCQSGYLFDCQKNLSIVAGAHKLERLWKTIDCLRKLAQNDGMTYESVDLAYIGLSGIWTEMVGSSLQRRVTPAPTKISEAIQGLIERKGIPHFEGARTDYPQHRQLCLAVCGWKFTFEALESECQELIDRGLYYQAIVQAALHGARHLALNMLRTLIREKTISNIGLGALLAADNLNDEQREMTHWMAADTEDPALKALLTFLSSGDWRDVMKTSYIHLGYRLALGLKYLNDTELSGFIQSETARAIRKGDLEGVLLTGLTEPCMDLFQTYVRKTNDLQTAVLATAFTNPLFVDDPRWEMWKETYFMQMQAWRAFTERTRFVIAHNKLARTRDGRCLIEPPAAQTKLICAHCKSEIGRPQGHPQARPKISGPAANAGIVCLKCGRHLPRCSICTLWLGTPDNRKVQPVSPDGARGKADMMENLLVFCNKCEHGAHAHHARDWFAKYNICPSPGCSCACKDKSAARSWTMGDIFSGRHLYPDTTPV